MSFTTICFTVTKRGGESAGQTVTREVAEFDWDRFKNTANAEAFARKAYFAAAQKLARELHEGKNPTEEHHLQSMESLIARSLYFTKKEIEKWCKNRDWSRAIFKKNPQESIQRLKESLPRLASSEYVFDESIKDNVANIIAAVADSKTDPIADFLFVKLTQGKGKNDMPIDF